MPSKVAGGKFLLPHLLLMGNHGRLVQDGCLQRLAEFDLDDATRLNSNLK